MPGPWDERAKHAGQPTPTNRLLFAMRAAGLKVVARDDVGEAGKYVGARYTFACGCVRVWRGDQRTGKESEHVTPCEAHPHLLPTLHVSPETS